MQTILVTGGAGFIGSNFVRHVLAASDARVVVLDALTYAGNLESLADVARDPRFAFVRGDIAERETVRALFREQRPDAVVNFAAETHVDRSIDDPSSFVRTNVLGTHELLEAARAHLRELPAAADGFRFLHVSTDEVYGTLGSDGLFSETTPYAPNSPYAASKAAADHLVRAWHETYGLPALITNCSNNYGPYQFPEKLIPLMILNALEGRRLPIYGDGGNVRDWLYVEDHCEGILLRAAQGRARRQVQRRRRQRAHEPAGGRRAVRRARGRAAGARQPGARGAGCRLVRRAQDLRRRPARPRPALRDRRHEDPARARLGPAPRVRERPAGDRALVPRQPRLVRRRAVRQVPARAARARGGLSRATRLRYSRAPCSSERPSSRASS